ncbi:MAG TPA: hypothetical protein VFE53_19815 [Mucilaginibacter sp.]|jgi:hypothetical protein|nr:hypothetical protein [Mucilaginibacter sp.]
MKKITLTLFTFFLFLQSYGQNLEWSFLANSGLYRYTGNYTVSTTFLNNVQANTKQGYANNPYGNLFGFSYGAGFQTQHITSGGFIFGLQASYDILRSKENINDVYPGGLYLATSDPFFYSGIPATGQSFLVSQDINFNPYIGYRLKTKKVKIDLMPGIDLGYNVSVSEYGDAKDQNGNKYQTSYYNGTLSPDILLRFGVAAWYKKLALTASYASGLTNFNSHLMNDNPTPQYTRSELIRFGLAIRLN